MDDVFNDAFNGTGEEREQPAATPAAAPEAPQPQNAETVETKQPAQAGGDDGATTAQGTEKHVPLAALEAERKGRQDWKEKAIRFEEELKAFKAAQQQLQQPQQPQQQLSQQEQLQLQMLSTKFDMSELAAREKHEDLDEMVNIFSEAARQNPALAAQLQTQKHPWEFAYKEGQRLKLAREMGDDPKAFREKLRAEVRAEILAEQQQQPAQSNQSAAPSVTHIPQSLASARSSAARGNSAWSGPTPLESMFPN